MATSAGVLTRREARARVRAALERRLTDASQRQSDRSIPAVRQRCANSLHEFVCAAWHVLEPATKFIDNWHIAAICDHLQAVSDGSITRLLVNIPPGSMKAALVEEPVLTTWGWKQHGDLAPGDFVFGLDGRPKRVLAATGHVLEACLTVGFDDGVSLTVGVAHEWLVERWRMDATTEWRRRYSSEVIETRALTAGARPDRIGPPDSVELPPRRFLIDPYLLGVWLGDGASGSGAIYAADEDVRHFMQLGEVRYTTDASSRGQAFHRIGVPELQTRLRVLGLLHDKHIPEEYLLSSVEQRTALLQGLMDTDGNVTKEGECNFWNADLGIAEGVAFLIASLGMKGRWHERFTILNGKRFGPHYRVSFRPLPGFQPFRLGRKAARVVFTTKDGRGKRASARYVKSLKPASERMVNCIEVEGGVYLLGRNLVPTHNSLLVSSFWPAWEWGPRQMTAMRYLTTSFAEIAVGRDCRRMRDLILSDWYRKHWPDVEMRRVGEFSFENTMTGSRDGVPFGSLTSKRADRLIIDDPHSVFKAESKAEREAAVRKFREGAINRLNDQQRSAIVVVMQRLHSGDIAGEILDGMNYVSLVLPMEYEAGRHCTTELGFSDPRRTEGELLCPKRWSPLVIEDLKRDMGPVGYAAQYQQRPVPRGGGILAYNGWEYWHKAVSLIYGRSENQFPDFEFMLGVLDTAYNEKQENDYSAFVVLGVWINLYGQPQVMLVHCWRKRMKFHDLVEEVIRSATKMRCERVLIENKAAGISVFQEIVRLTRDEGFAVQLVDPKSEDKEARANSISHFLGEERDDGTRRPGIVWVPAVTQADGAIWPRGWGELLMAEASEFPKGKHDDLVDCFVHGMRFLRQRGLVKRAREVEVEETNVLREAGLERAAAAPLYPI